VCARDRDRDGESLDVIAAALAAAQEGVISRDQLRDIGFGEDAIDLRIARRRLTVIFEGVYAWGHASRTPRSLRWAAVLAVGYGADVGGRSAGSAYDFCAASPMHVELAVPPGRVVRRKGIRARRLLRRDDERTTLEGLPIVIPMRAFFDAAIGMQSTQLKRMTAEAERVRVFDGGWLARLCARYPKHPAAGKIGRLLDAQAPVPDLHSDAEWAFDEFLDRWDLPRPEQNVWIPALNREADNVYSEARVMLEIDGYETHGTRTAFEDDRTRDLDLKLAGWDVVRITWRAMHERPEVLAGKLRRLLVRSAAA
jgi:hypothetical protein